jgi:hypothetical protein
MIPSSEVFASAVTGFLQIEINSDKQFTVLFY